MSGDEASRAHRSALLRRSDCVARSGSLERRSTLATSVPGRSPIAKLGSWTYRRSAGRFTANPAQRVVHTSRKERPLARVSARRCEATSSSTVSVARTSRCCTERPCTSKRPRWLQIVA